MDNFVAQEESDLKNIFNRFKKRNFSGNTGQAIKNSSYQLAQNLIMKFGSLLFTIIVARMLLPERMGLYSLALSTILFFSAFSDFGISTAIITFISKSLGKNSPERAKAYAKKLFKIKGYLLIACMVVLLASAYYVSNFYYKKPIFFALLAGALYIPAMSLVSFVEQLFKSTNNFRMPLVKEIIFQILRLILIPLGILVLLKTNISNSGIVAMMILILTMCYFISLLIFLIVAKKKLSFLKGKSEKLNSSDVRELRRFILPMSLTVLSGIFFGYIDTLMLGHFVESSYIAYYGAAFSLVGSAIAIISFTSAALFPLFSKLEGISLEKLFRKSRNITILISLASGIFTFFVAYYIVRLAYGVAYLNSVAVLKLFAILVFILPISGIYDNYIFSRGKTKFLAILIALSTILNIGFNYFGITYGIAHYGAIGGVYGACAATILSRIIYLFGVIEFRKRLRPRASKSF